MVLRGIKFILGQKRSSHFLHFHIFHTQLFPAAVPKKLTSGNKTIFAYLGSQETLRVITAPADTADSSASRYTYMRYLHFGNSGFEKSTQLVSYLVFLPKNVAK